MLPIMQENTPESNETRPPDTIDSKSRRFRPNMTCQYDIITSWHSIAGGQNCQDICQLSQREGDERFVVIRRVLRELVTENLPTIGRVARGSARSEETEMPTASVVVPAGVGHVDGWCCYGSYAKRLSYLVDYHLSDSTWVIMLI